MHESFHVFDLDSIVPLDQDKQLTLGLQMHHVAHIITRRLHNGHNDLIIYEPLFTKKYLKVLLVKTFGHVLDYCIQAKKNTLIYMIMFIRKTI